MCDCLVRQPDRFTLRSKKNDLSALSRVEIRFPAIHGVTIKMIGKLECAWLHVQIPVGFVLQQFVPVQLLVT